MPAMPTSFANQLLIAMPGMDDPNFHRAVALVCQHDEEGAMGIVINRGADYTLGELLAQMDIVPGDLELGEIGVFAGGPVQPERGFVLHDGPRAWNSTLRLAPGLAVTTSRDILDAMARGDGPPHALVALGYAGWGAGQLEAEIAQNSWLTVPADEAILFRTPPEERWQAATRGLGFDPGQLSDYAGHA
jgi:putative transcriptional regulator